MERWEHARAEFERKGIDPDKKFKSDPKRYARLKEPEPPEGFRYRDVWFDLSPMRPDEYCRQVAARWERAEQIQGAYHKGKRLEKAKRTYEAESKQRSQDKIEALKQKV